MMITRDQPSVFVSSQEAAVPAISAPLRQNRQALASKNNMSPTAGKAHQTYVKMSAIASAIMQVGVLMLLRLTWKA